MKRLIRMGALAAVAAAVGVLAVRAEWYPNGIRATGIIVAPGEGEGEGEPDADTLTFESDQARIVYEGLEYAAGSEYVESSVYGMHFKDIGILRFEGDVGAIAFAQKGMFCSRYGGVYVFGPTNDWGGAMLGGPPEIFIESLLSSYFTFITSNGVAGFGGETGFVTAGRFSMTGQEQVPEFTGAFLLGQEAGADVATALVHAAPTGGLGEGEGEEETGPIAEMVAYAPPAQGFPTEEDEKAYVRLKGSDTEGAVYLWNAAKAAITINETGAVIIQLGGVSEPAGLGGGGGNTGSMMSAPDAMSVLTSASEESPPARPSRPAPRIGIHAVKDPFSKL